MANEAQTGLRLDLLTAMWRRRKWLAIVVFVAAASAAGSLVAFLPNIYSATTMVLVEGQQVPEALVKPTVTGAFETRLHAITQEILSRARLEELITRFDLYPQLRTRQSSEELTKLMREHIQLELKDTRGRVTAAFALSYRGSDPEKAALVANALASFYVEENVKVRERQSTGTTEFLRTQLEETRRRLDEQERRVSEFKKRHLGELPQQTEANLAILERLHTQLRLNGDKQMRTMERWDALARPVVEVAVPAGPPSRPEARPTYLDQLREQLNGLRAHFTDRYPDVIRLQATIARLEAELGEAKPDEKADEPVVGAADSSARASSARAHAEALLEMNGEIKILKNEEQALRKSIATYQARVESAPRREQEFLELSRDHQGTRDLYQSLSRRYDEAQIAESMEQRQKGEQFRILAPALPPQTPAAPNRPRLMLLGLAVALGVSIGVVVLADRIDSSFHTVDQVRSFTRVPVLTSIPQIVSASDARRRWWHVGFGAVAVVLGLILMVGAGYVVAFGNEELLRIMSRGRS